MKVLVVYCHPVEASYGAALHAAVLDGLSSADHEITDVDLYRENFDPVLKREERLKYNDTTSKSEDVRRYTEQLSSADGLVLVYPSWWYGLPAMLKGYFDRVWLPGVAFDLLSHGRIGTARLCRLNRIVVVTTYGSPWWLIRLYLADPTRKFVNRGLRRICGGHCRIYWFVKYDMDRSTHLARSSFIEKVRKGVARIYDCR
jgi:putative NADPH-quinone reductase